MHSTTSVNITIYGRRFLKAIMIRLDACVGACMLRMVRVMVYRGAGAAECIGGQNLCSIEGSDKACVRVPHLRSMGIFTGRLVPSAVLGGGMQSSSSISSGAASCCSCCCLLCASVQGFEAGVSHLAR